MYWRQLNFTLGGICRKVNSLSATHNVSALLVTSLGAREDALVRIVLPVHDHWHASGGVLLCPSLSLPPPHHSVSIFEIPISTVWQWLIWPNPLVGGDRGRARAPICLNELWSPCWDHINVSECSQMNGKGVLAKSSRTKTYRQMLCIRFYCMQSSNAML